MRRLQELLRLVRRATGRQDELVNHDLMFEFIHFFFFNDEARVLLRGVRLLRNRLSDLVPLVFLHSGRVPSLRLSRPPLQPLEQTQIFTVGAVGLVGPVA